MNKKVRIFLGLPKSLYICLRSLKFKDAIKLPILVSANTKLCSLSGSIRFTEKLRPGMLRIGLDGAGTSLHMPTAFENQGELICGDNVRIGGGCQICTVAKESSLSIENGVRIMGESHIVAADSVTIGEKTIISWDTQIMDTDFHKIMVNGVEKPVNAPVHIGKNCWIASRVNILKNTTIPSGCVIASSSTIRGTLDTENAVYSGYPIKILAKDISWEP